jgi:hypothetical protein
VKEHFLRAHRFPPFTHKRKREDKGFEQGFPSLSTETVSGYYYYLYIYKTPLQANCGLNQNFLKVSQTYRNVGNFQEKKMRNAA